MFSLPNEDTHRMRAEKDVHMQIKLKSSVLRLDMQFKFFKQFKTSRHKYAFIIDVRF